jgi:site-specific recombinase XerD
VTALIPAVPSFPALSSHTEYDAQVISLWLHGRGTNTREAYTRDIAQFFQFVRKPMPEVTLRDVQEFVDSLQGAVSTKRRVISAVKSLFSFALKIGYLRFSVAAAVLAPKAMDRLAERIPPEAKIHEMIALTPEGRDRLLLQTLYATGARVSEICRAKWRDTQANGKSGQKLLFSEKAPRLMRFCCRARFGTNSYHSGRMPTMVRPYSRLENTVDISTDLKYSGLFSKPHEELRYGARYRHIGFDTRMPRIQWTVALEFILSAQL